MNSVFGFSLDEIEAKRMEWQAAADKAALREPQITLFVTIPEDMQEVVVIGELEGGNLKAQSQGHVGLGRALIDADAVESLFYGIISSLQAHRFRGG